MKQVLAGIVAVALVAGAWYVRTTFIEDDEAAAGDGGDGGTQVEEGTGTIACDEQLEDACPAGSTRLSVDELLSTFADPAADFDVLVAPSIVVQMIEESGQSRATFSQERPAVATTAVVAAVAAGEAVAVAEACGGNDAVTWECLADQVGAGTLKAAFESPLTSSDGIVQLAALTGGFFTGAGLGFNRNNFDAEFTTWLAEVRRIQTSPDAIADIVRFNGARNDSAVAVEAEALPTIARIAQNAPVLMYPAPLASIAVVAVAIGGTDPDDAAEVGEAVGEALRADGWRDADGGSVEGGPALPDDDGLPVGGVLVALQQAWS